MSGPNAPWNGIVRARLLGANSVVLAEVEGHIGLSSALSATEGVRNGTVDRRNQIGPARLGMSGTALRQAVASARDTSWDSRAGENQRGIWVPLGTAGRTLAVLSSDTVVRLEVSDPAVRTREQLGVGSRLDELRSSYGSGCANTSNGVVYVSFANAPGISFAMDTPMPSDVAQWRVNADGLPANAVVSRWWLHRGANGCTP
jgi:hypothetical protein